MGDGSWELDRRRSSHRPTIERQVCGALGGSGDLASELCDALASAARDRLEGRHHQRHQPSLVVERLEHRHRDHGRAVRVRHDALGDVVQVVCVDLGHDEGYGWIHPPRRRVVNHDRAGCSELGRQHPRRGGARCAERDVDALEAGGGGILDDDLAAREGEHAAGRALRGEEPDVVEREGALLEQGAHDRTCLTGGADDCDPHGIDRTEPSARRRQWSLSRRGRRRRAEL